MKTGAQYLSALVTYSKHDGLHVVRNIPAYLFIKTIKKTDEDNKDKYKEENWLFYPGPSAIYI